MFENIGGIDPDRLIQAELSDADLLNHLWQILLEENNVPPYVVEFYATNLRSVVKYLAK